MWLDNVIGWFFPRSGYTRLKYREMHGSLRRASKIRNRFSRKYEGATKGRRTANWNASSKSANAEIKTDLLTLRNRSRDLVRNDAYAARGIRLIGTNVVGKGVRANIKTTAGDPAPEKVLELWNAWAHSTEIDFDGKRDLFGMQKLVMESTPESGEVLVRRRIVADSDFPFKLQILESDHIASDIFAKTSENSNQIMQGIEIDSQGRVVAYHLYEEHPGDISTVQNLKDRFKTIRIPVDEISHPFRIERPSQLRGVPWLAPVMIRLRDLGEYEEAQIVRQKIAACFSIFITDPEPLDKNLSEEQREELGEKVEPGIIELLPPGKEVKFGNPPGVEGYREYTGTVLHAIASGLGISFEALTGDLSEVNFSSARMGFLEMSRNVESWRETILNRMFNDKVFQWFLQGAGLVGQTAPDLSVSWIAPRREMVDPTKEVPARIKAIRAGIESLDDAVIQNGKDPKRHYKEISETNAMLDSLGLVFDSDPRKVSNTGNAQQVEDTESFNGNSPEE